MQANVTNTGQDAAARRTSDSAPGPAPAATPATTPATTSAAALDGGVIVTGETAIGNGSEAALGAAGLLGGDAAEDAAILIQLMPSIGARPLFDSSGKVDQEALNKLFLELCDSLKTLALSGALGEAEEGGRLAEKMDQLKDSVIELQDKIQRAVAELQEAEKRAEASKAINVAVAWLGVVASAMGAALTAGAGGVLFGAAIAGAVFAGANASLQTASFAGAEKLDPRSDAYRAATTSFMALELVCCLGTTALVSFTGPKMVKAASSAAGSGDEAAEGAARAATEAADGRGAAAGRMGGEAANVDEVDPLTRLLYQADDEIEHARQIQARQHYHFQKFAVLLDMFAVVAECARSAVSIVAQLRITDARSELLGLQQEQKPIEDSLAYVQTRRQFAAENRNTLRKADADLQNSQFDLIRRVREVGEAMVETNPWRRI